MQNIKNTEPKYEFFDKEGYSHTIDPDMQAIIHEGFARLLNLENDRDFIRGANLLIRDNLGGDIEIHGQSGSVHATKRTVLKINNLSRLRAVLDNNLAKIFGEENPNKKLIEIACDADNPIAPRVRECVTISEIIDIVWRPSNVNRTTH